MKKNVLLFKLKETKLQIEEKEYHDLERETKILMLLDILLDYIGDVDIRDAVEDITI